MTNAHLCHDYALLCTSSYRIEMSFLSYLSFCAKYGRQHQLEKKLTNAGSRRRRRRRRWPTSNKRRFSSVFCLLVQSMADSTSWWKSRQEEELGDQRPTSAGSSQSPENAFPAKLSKVWTPNCPPILSFEKSWPTPAAGGWGRWPTSNKRGFFSSVARKCISCETVQTVFPSFSCPCISKLDDAPHLMLREVLVLCFEITFCWLNLSVDYWKGRDKFWWQACSFLERKLYTCQGTPVPGLSRTVVIFYIYLIRCFAKPI